MKIRLFALVFLAFTSSCATILQNGPDKFMVTSNPPGATIYVDEQAVGQTPLLVGCNKDSECRIRVEKEGYQPYFFDKDKELAGWFIGSILLNPLWIVDLATHTQGKYSQDPIYVNMAQTPPSARVPSSEPEKQK